MEPNGNGGRKRQRATPAVSQEEKLDEEQLRELERRLESVRSTKLVLQEKLTELNAEAAKLELLDRKSRQHVDAQATKLTRMQQLQADAARRQEEAVARRVEQEAARTQREEEERARRAHAVDVTMTYNDDPDLTTLEDFLADDAAHF